MIVHKSDVNNIRKYIISYPKSKNVYYESYIFSPQSLELRQGAQNITFNYPDEMINKLKKETAELVRQAIKDLFTSSSN